MNFYSIFCIVVFFCYFAPTLSQDVTTTDTKSNLPQDWEYCFEFTWLGPSYNNVSMYNGSCTDYLDDTRATGTPCSPPIVISYDGTLPDMDYLWEHHQASILCKRAVDQVCAKYTYFYDGLISNITYLCTKVQAMNEGPVTSGCYKQKIESYDVELCVCKSDSGVYRPCNAAPSINAAGIGLGLSIILLLLR